MSVESVTRRRLLAAFGGAGILLGAPAWALPKKTPGKPLNVALAGLGSYASEQLAPGLALTKHCRLAGIVTGTASKIPQWQSKYKIPDRNVYNYENFDQIADNGDIDVVYIVTPTHLHAPLTLRAAAAGKHVWCEKPMAMNAGECEAMIAACKRNKVALTIGYRMQHEPNTRRLIAMASEKPFGAMQRVRAEAGYNGYHDATKADRPWRLRSQFGGGAMYDMGVYPLNAARYTVGAEPVAVTAKRWTDRPELFDEVDRHMDFTAGISQFRACCMQDQLRCQHECAACRVRTWLVRVVAVSGLPGRHRQGQRWPRVRRQGAAPAGTADG